MTYPRLRHSAPHRVGRGDDRAVAIAVGVLSVSAQELCRAAHDGEHDRRAKPLEVVVIDKAGIAAACVVRRAAAMSLKIGACLVSRSRGFVIEAD